MNLGVVKRLTIENSLPIGTPGISPKNLLLLNASPFPVPNAVIGEGRVERAIGLEPIQKRPRRLLSAISRLNRLVRAK
jgi:hypothetical protein